MIQSEIKLTNIGISVSPAPLNIPVTTNIVENKI